MRDYNEDHTVIGKCEMKGVAMGVCVLDRREGSITVGEEKVQRLESSDYADIEIVKNLKRSAGVTMNQ